MSSFGCPIYKPRTWIHVRASMLYLRVPNLGCSDYKYGPNSQCSAYLTRHPRSVFRVVLTTAYFLSRGAYIYGMLWLQGASDLISTGCLLSDGAYNWVFIFSWWFSLLGASDPRVPVLLLNSLASLYHTRRDFIIRAIRPLEPPDCAWVPPLKRRSEKEEAIPLTTTESYKQVIIQYTCICVLRLFIDAFVSKTMSDWVCL